MIEFIETFGFVFALFGLTWLGIGVGIYWLYSRQQNEMRRLKKVTFAQRSSASDDNESSAEPNDDGDGDGDGGQTEVVEVAAAAAAETMEQQQQQHQ